MRSRQEIEAANGRDYTHKARPSLELEVLLDIRELLERVWYALPETDDIEGAVRNALAGVDPLPGSEAGQ